MKRCALHHIAVLVSDLERAEHFYSGVLGLPILQRWHDENGEPRACWLSLGDGKVEEPFLALELATAEESAEGSPGWHCVALTINHRDRHSFRDHLEANGHPVEKESDFTLYVRDPDGTLLGLSHFPRPK